MNLPVPCVAILGRGVRRIVFVFSALMAVGGGSQLASAATVFVGPTPYLSFADSPFTGGFAYFHLENFEDGALNSPGLSSPIGVVASPNALTDSVDGDDGAIDGSGAAGRSWFSSASTSTFSFAFDGVALGTFPTHAGVVWTDVGQSTPVTGVTAVTLEAFGPGGASLGTLGPFTLGDGQASGGTAEDRFFGAIDEGGISRISMTVVGSVDWEVDHVQYGRVPEPSAIILMLTGLAAARWGWKKRSLIVRSR